MHRAILCLAALVITGLISGCQTQTGYGPHATTHRYTEASLSGLRTLAPYPNHDDVCQTIDKKTLPEELATRDDMMIACPKHETGAIGDRRSEGAKIVAYAKHWTVLSIRSKKSNTATAGDRSNLTAAVAGTTIVTYDTFHGTQVEYRDPDGGAWLVYPGNSGVLPGQWRVSPNKQLCHRYHSSGTNPATGVIGWEWECSTPPSFTKSTPNYQILQGDVFRLYRRNAFPDTPRLKGKMSVAELKALFGV